MLLQDKIFIYNALAAGFSQTEIAKIRNCSDAKVSAVLNEISRTEQKVRASWVNEDLISELKSQKKE